MTSKHILYIGTPIFSYHRKIIGEFEAQGYSVDYYNDRPSENSLIKGVIKIKKHLATSFIRRYFDGIVSETKGKTYDMVFIVNCKVFTPQMIRTLRQVHMSARFVLYMWDSLALYPESKNLIQLFDTAYSFDMRDCETVEGLKFLPLFYSREYEVLAGLRTEEREYDIVNVCTVHPNRYRVLNRALPLFHDKGFVVFTYMFLNRLQYVYNKAFVHEFKQAKYSEFKFKPLPEKVLLKVLHNSGCVLDIPHEKQSGLTMRTIETLGAKKKLITTNETIRNYDFYNENNVYVLNDHNLDGLSEFVSGSFSPIHEDVYKAYSLRSWVQTILWGST